MKKTKLIPFTIEAWKAGGKPVTRGGREVLELTQLKSIKNYPLIGSVSQLQVSFTIEGDFLDGTESCHDLMLEVEDTEKELYLVIITSPITSPVDIGYNLYVSSDIEYSKTKNNYLTHLKLPPCNS